MRHFYFLPCIVLVAALFTTSSVLQLGAVSAENMTVGLPGTPGPIIKTRADCIHIPPYSGAPTPVGCRMLRFAQIPGYQLAIRGTRWGLETPVTLIFRQGTRKETLRLQATRRGSFLIGVGPVSACAGFVVKVRDLGRHQTTLAGPHATCLERASNPLPALRVLEGTAIS
ncbi:MAG: hypothetical protein NVS2B16_21780 [Chloroflexota bacterium]